MMLPLWILHPLSLKIPKITRISIPNESNFLLSILIKIISIEFVINQLYFIPYLLSSFLSLPPPIGSGAGGVWFGWRHITGKVEEAREFLVVGDHHLVSACGSLGLLGIPLVIMGSLVGRGNQVDAGLNSVGFMRASKWEALLLTRLHFHSAE